MKNPLVSIVMPAHNYGRFIAEAIESFVAQTFADFELIVVDDASTDDTVEVVQGYDDSRIALIKRQVCSCSGVWARNDGLSAAGGSLIAVADADDVSLPDRLEQQVNFLRRYPEIDIVGGGLIPVDQNGSPIGLPVLKPVYRNRPDRYRKALLMGRPVVLHGTLMFRKHILKQLRGYGDYASSGDYEFLLRASRYFRLCNLNEILIYCRQHASSVTRTYGARLKRRHHKVFLERELLWTRKHIDRTKRPPLTTPGDIVLAPAKTRRARPHISIVMPTHNCARFVGDAIQSILAQAYGDFELIIIDDGSTDGTRERLAHYPDDRIVFIRRQECSCSCDWARNDGLAIARGDLIAIADADDLSVPNRFEQQVAYLTRHPEIDVVGGAMIRIDEAGDPFGPIMAKASFEHPAEYRDALLQDSHVMFHPTMMFRRRVLDRVPGYTSYPAAADFEFLLRASRYFNLSNLKDVLVYYRQHPTSVTRSFGARLRNVHHEILLNREYLWVQKEIARLQNAQEPST